MTSISRLFEKGTSKIRCFIDLYKRPNIFVYETQYDKSKYYCIITDFTIDMIDICEPLYA